MGKRGPKKGAIYSKTVARRVGMQAAMRIEELTAARTLQEIGRTAFSDPRAFFHHGRLKSPDELTADQAAALASFETVVENAAGGDGHTDTIHKVKFWNKLHALELLARHFQLLQDTVKIEAGDDLLKILDEGRQRVAAMRAERAKRR